MQIFLSHSHSDYAIAVALKDLLEDFFGAGVDIHFSSDQDQGRGVEPGVQWRQWIRDRVQGAAKTVVILTPRSSISPWVLWEAGAAEGIAAATSRPDAVVPLVVGLDGEDQLPEPIRGTQFVRGDADGEQGIQRLLQDVNKELNQPLSPRAFKAISDDYVAPYVNLVTQLVSHSVPQDGLLASIPNTFAANRLVGHWVTAYQFDSGGNVRTHIDISEVSQDAGRRLRAKNGNPLPATEGRIRPFFNEIEADLVNRHFIGHWRNLSDTRYFGSLHLAVLPGESVMQGHYSALDDDVRVSAGSWKWVRLDPQSIGQIELNSRVMGELQTVWDIVQKHHKDDGMLDVDSVTVPRS